nr:hypothetical protein [Tanacetum cinerariifolium]
MEAKVLEVVKGTNVERYTQRFQELALLCGRMFPEESDKVEKYVSGLLDMIQGSMMASKPKAMQEEFEIANNLMDQKAEWLKLTPLRLVKGRSMLEIFHCATSACFTVMARALQRNYKSDYLELKNQNHGNQVEGTKACEMLYALGGGETNQDLDDMEDDINA